MPASTAPSAAASRIRPCALPTKPTSYLIIWRTAPVEFQGGLAVPGMGASRSNHFNLTLIPVRPADLFFALRKMVSAGTKNHPFERLEIAASFEERHLPIKVRE